MEGDIKMKKKPYLLILSTVIIILILTACKSSTPSGKEVIYTGYVIDQMCGVVDKDTTAQSDEKCAMVMSDGDDKIDFIKNPEKHTNACNLMPSCSKSGFGISIKQADGNYKYFKFDKAGSKLAKSEIVDKTKKKDNITAQVTGVITKDTIKISKISEN